jgi:L-alanine-DL-glutamate epimerase-like enolase superfamily enzyme
VTTTIIAAKGRQVYRAGCMTHVWSVTGLMLCLQRSVAIFADLRSPAAALILLEHHWAVPLRDAIVRAGGFRISDGLISPLDLVGIGLATAEEARELRALETAGAAKP